MDLEYVTKLIELLSKSAIDELEIEEDGKRVRITKSPHANAAPATVFQVTPPASAPHIPVAQQGAHVAPPTLAPPPPVAAPSAKLHEIRSPIVGTFYRAPAPDAPTFVQVGSVVQKGTVLCIVEAMKLMNEIESDVAGKIVQIMVENQQPVEYDQVLFVVEPA
jgi:acetyl-CoA carboxylase biotin carboxyl carrier protein